MNSIVSTDRSYLRTQQLMIVDSIVGMGLQIEI